jgi:beta-1,4-glucosyltransferase
VISEASLNAISEMSSDQQVQLGGFNLSCTTHAALQQRMQEILHGEDQYALLFANTNFIVQCQPLQNEINRSNTIIVNDGIGIDIATWLIHRHTFPENLNGTDFVPHYLHSVREHARVFLLGGKPGVAARAAVTLKEQFGVDVVGTCDGYCQANNIERVLTSINATRANVVLVAMGNPLQEQWILDYRTQLDARVLIGVGALFDFLAGDKPRAPRILQRLRLEWLYRLCLEPSRLLRRYTVDIGVFLALCLRKKHSDS